MPWTVSDVDKHKKGLSPDEKKKWVDIANGIYSDCMAEGKTDKVCAAKAIRIANSKFSEDGMSSAPKEALTFQEMDNSAFAKDGEEENVYILGYSGKVIKNHWYWGDLVIDVAGMKFPQKFYPVLEDHYTSKKIGFTAKPITDNQRIEVSKMVFVDTPESLQFQKVSKEGFPYQASIYAQPSRVEELMEGVSAEVNGFTFKGPGCIWRESTFKEVSVCVFGQDSQTKSRAFSEDGPDISYKSTRVVPEGFSEGEDKQTETEEVKGVDLKELKEKDPNAFSVLLKDATDLVKVEFESQMTALTGKVTELTAKLAESQTVIAGMSKEVAISKEEGRRNAALRIWTEKLTASDIPEYLFGKVMGMVSYTKYVENDILDEKAFTGAVDAEIKDWTDLGVKESVLGMGHTGKGAADAEEAKKTQELAEVDSWVNDMMRLAGQSVAKT